MLVPLRGSFASKWVLLSFTQRGKLWRVGCAPPRVSGACVLGRCGGFALHITDWVPHIILPEGNCCASFAVCFYSVKAIQFVKGVTIFRIL